MQTNTRELGFVNYNGQEMNFVKYNGATVYEAWKKLLASGIPPLTLLKCKQANLVDYKVYGESMQNGTPTPDTPIEVESVGEPTINLVKDVREVFAGYAAYTELEEDGRQCIRFQSNNHTVYNLGFKENTRYTISCWSKCVKRPGYGTNYPGADIILAVRYTDGSYSYFSTPSDGVWRYCTYVTASNKTIASIGSHSYHWTTYIYVDINTFQIQEGAVATEYEPYGYKIPIKASGVNLFSMAKSNFTTTTINGITYTPLDDERVHIKGKLADITKNSYYQPGMKTNIPIKAGKYRAKYNDYTWNNLTLLFQIRKDGNFLANVNTVNGVTNVSDDGYIGGVLIGVAAGSTREWDNIIELQLVEGTANLPYEPYIEPVTTNIYLKEPLRKIGDYADYIDFENSKIVRNTFMRVYDGISNTNNPFNKSDNEENFAGSENHGDVLSDFWLYTLNDTLPIIPKNGHHSANDYKQVPMCLQLPVKTGYYDANTSDATVDKEMLWFCQQGRGVRLYLSKDRCGGKRTDILTYLRSNPITVLFATYEPYTEDITLPNIPTHKGTTIIEVDTSITPSNMEVTYLGKK